MSLSSRNYDSYGQNSNRKTSYAQSSSLAELQKSIREQKILLSALPDSSAGSVSDIESLKRRIETVNKQIHNSGSRLQSSKPELLLSRYSSRMRQLSDLADHQRAMQKEIEFTLNTTIKDLEKQIARETEKLNQKELELARIRDAKASGSTAYNPSMSEADRIRSKAQAMIAARLNKTAYTESSGAEAKKVESAIEDRDQQLQRELAKVDDVRSDMRRVLDAAMVSSDIEQNERQLKEQRMFEDGLFVSEELSDFIESLRRDRAQKTAIDQRYTNGSNRYGPPPAAPPLPRQYSPAPPPLPAPVPTRHHTTSLAPPPIPTSHRPQTPRSAEAIKAEAHRRIDEKRMSFQNPPPPPPPAAAAVSDTDDTEYKLQIQEAEKAAQAKLREAERLAQIRLDKFNQRKKEAEASRLAAEKKALKEEEERLERERAALEQERIELEKKKKAEEEQRLIQEQLEMERQRIEQEKLQIEREEKEARERQRKLEEETLAAEKAKEEEAERLRRAQEELERAKKAEEEKRREAEAAEKEQRRLLELERQRLEAAAEEERKRKEAEAEEERKRKEAEEERKRKEAEEAKEEGIWLTDLDNEERRTRNSTDFRHAKSFPTSFSFNNALSEESESESEAEPELELDAGQPQETNATAGTAGFGTDLDDEVDFSTIYRVKALYDYHGTRPDDLSVAEDEIIKAHPSKDSDSDWWYGTSLKTNNCGFFPRTYCEVIEQAFKVKTLYEYKGIRDDDLSFQENEIVTVQPFQDQDSEWWFGTSNATKEAGYFPRSYVQVINHERKESVPNIIVHQPKPQHNIPILDNQPSSNITLTPSRSTPTSKTTGRSAPSSPVIRNASPTIRNIGRRRATSNASVMVSSPMAAPGSARSGSPVIIRPVSPNVLNTWAATMDAKELVNVGAEERKRQEAIYELIVTERTYLHDLQLIVNVFYANSSQYLSPDAQNLIFSNVEDLLLCNTAILSDLEDRQLEGANFVSGVGDIFLTHAENLKCYQTYCRNQSAASKFLQKKRDEDKVFAAFLKSCQSRPECRALDLSSFLLEPMQRITRYPLLLRQILQSTAKYHHDHGMVADAIERTEQVLKEVNEAARKHENKQKLQELSRLVDLEGLESIDRAGREFMMEGPLYKAKSGRKLHACLFNDMLILAQPIRGLSPQGYLYTLYKEPMPTDRIFVRGSAKLGLDDAGFQIVYGESIISVKAATASMKKQWMTRISQASSVLSAAKRT